MHWSVIFSIQVDQTWRLTPSCKYARKLPSIQWRNPSFNLMIQSHCSLIPWKSTLPQSSNIWWVCSALHRIDRMAWVKWLKLVRRRKTWQNRRAASNLTSIILCGIGDWSVLWSIPSRNFENCLTFWVIPIGTGSSTSEMSVWINTWYK